MADAPAPNPPAAAEAPPANPNRRRRLFAIFGAVLLIGGLGYGLWWLLVGSHHVTTDDAYVTADLAQITPLYAAAVKEVRAHDTQPVRKGDVLVVLDDTDAQVALAQAEAELGRATRRVRGYGETDLSLKAQVAGRDADVARARSQVAQARSGLEKAKTDLDRRKSIVARGAVSAEEVTTAENAYTIARTNLDAAVASLSQARSNAVAARAQLASNRTLTEGASVATNPEVASYRAKVDQAKHDVERTVLRSPIDGIVAKRNVQVGQRVAVGTALMSVVPQPLLFVDANFKEVQLRHLRIGQSVSVTSDLYGDDVEYRGTVIGRGGGSGSSFAIIPSQNATGNWIKVVQRVPVRIRLDAGEVARHPLAVGLSMSVDVDTSSGDQDRPAR